MRVGTKKAAVPRGPIVVVESYALCAQNVCVSMLDTDERA